MRRQIITSLNEEESARFEALLKGRTAYAYALEAIREKMQREERANT